MLPVSGHAREALRLAHEEARALRHSYIGTEHVLLGLLCERSGEAASALAPLDVTHERVRKAVVRMMGVGVDDVPGELPFTGAASERSTARRGRRRCSAPSRSAPSTSCSR